jgi:glycerol-3-phosphate acyltransferase PlsX
MKYRVGVDISGGDFAPGEIFKGALLASKEGYAQVVLIGDRNEILDEAKKEKADVSACEIVDAPEKIAMDEQAALSIRRKRKSSIVIGTKLLEEKTIDAFVSCGNTGAMVAGATLELGLIEGVERPGIGVLLPTAKGVTLLIDVGANVSAKPLHLLQYGLMASIYYGQVFNVNDPTVGLLNIGEEETKGSEFAKTVHKLFASSHLNFIGNLEAKQIFSGICNCVVCDGFVGNIALKVSEGLGETISAFIIDAIKSDPLGKIGFLLARRSLRKFKQVIDYAEYGGAPLLGVNGVVIIGHGRSSAYAVKNAVRAAVSELQRDIIGKIRGRLDEICKDSGIGKILAA